MSRIALCLIATLTLSACANGQFMGGMFDRRAQEPMAPAPVAPGDTITEEVLATPETAPRIAPENLDRAVADAEALAEAEIAAAAAEPAQVQGGGALGETIASLGDPTQPGLWLETPLVTTPQDGRAVDASGNAVNLRLIPSGGEPGSGSRMSLAAMRVLGANLADLVAVEVFAGA